MLKSANPMNASRRICLLLVSILVVLLGVQQASADPVSLGIFQISDLSITKADSPDPVHAGANLTYTITVANNGPDAAATSSWSDTLPAGTTFVSLPNVAGWSCTTPSVGATGLVSCSNPTFAVGSSVFTLTVAVDPSVADGTVLSNTAAVMSSGSTEGNPGDESDTETTTVTASADLSVTKTDNPDPVTAGNDLTYTITVNNAGPSNAAGVSLSDTLPAGQTFVSLSSPGGWLCTTPAVGSGGMVSCSIASLGLGNAVFTLVVHVDPSTPHASDFFTNTATVTSTTSDPNAGNESGDATTSVVASSDLAITITDAPDPVIAGNNLTYTITLTNNGPSDRPFLTGFTTVVPAASTTFVSATVTTGSGWTLFISPPPGGTGNIVFSKAAGMVAGETAVFSVVVHVNGDTPDGTVINNLAGTSTGPPDPDDSDNFSTTTTTVGPASADLSITKTDTPDPVMAGTNLTYSITVTNAGPSNATTASFSDTLPAGTTFVSLVAPGPWGCTTPPVGSGGTVFCSATSFPAGSTVFPLTVAVSATAGGGTVISNTATTTSPTADPNLGNESDTETTSVLSPATVTGTKTASGPFTQGSNVTYTIVLSNSGPAAQGDNPGDEFVDVLPSQLTLISANATSGTAAANVGTNTVTWNGAIPAGGSVTITIVALVEPDAPVGSTITNQGTIHSDADGNGTNEATGVTDDPSQPGSGNGTAFVVGAPASALSDIPALDPRSMIALATFLAAIGVLIARRS